jgi:hypothetical protein
MVLPEDDANRQLANGFLLDDALSTQIQVLEEAGGWIKVLDDFKSAHVAEMDRYPSRFMVLLIDFDGQERRMNEMTAKVPERLRPRVFIIGARTEPEDLKKAGLGSYESIGSDLARDCREETEKTWGHELLRHNEGELVRLRESVRRILFG